MKKVIVNSPSEVLPRICRSEGAWGMSLRLFRNDGGEPTLEDVADAAPWLDQDVSLRLLTEGSLYIVFETFWEMDAAYRRTVGEDGPTSRNPHNGPGRVSALTCNPKGELLTHNY